MREEYRLKYICNRVLLLAAAVFLLLLIQAAAWLLRFLQGGTGLWQGLIHGAAAGLYGAVYWFWIIVPYRKGEKWIGHFLDGYGIPDSREADSFLLTPYMKRQIEMAEKVLKAPGAMDFNKRQAQYLALQNQINPHFLYNTLESIRGEALLAGLNSVADMTEALAKFFRYTITKVENLVSVEEELDNCETYFRIQKYRFGDRLRLHVECDEEDREDIMNCRIPKLTLQPIMENSIIHGTELKVGTGNLKLQFERTDSRLIIRLSDDGVGMDEHTLARLNRKLAGEAQTASYQEDGRQGGIALVNVNNRIHLIFGEEYGLHVYSVPQKGTDVEISVPVVARERQLPNRGILS